MNPASYKDSQKVIQFLIEHQSQFLMPEISDTEKQQGKQIYLAESISCKKSNDHGKQTTFLPFCVCVCVCVCVFFVLLGKKRNLHMRFFFF